MKGWAYIHTEKQLFLLCALTYLLLELFKGLQLMVLQENLTQPQHCQYAVYGSLGQVRTHVRKNGPGTTDALTGVYQ